MDRKKLVVAGSLSVLLFALCVALAIVYLASGPETGEPGVATRGDRGPPESGETAPEPEALEPAAGQESRAIAAVDEGDFAVTGRVVDASGRAVPDAEVVLLDGGAEMDEILSRSLALDSGEASGRLRQMRSLLSDGFRGRRTVSTLAAGTFQFTGLVVGTYRVAASSPHLLAAVTSGLVLDEETPVVADVVLTLASGGVVRGVVLRPDSRVISGARVDVEWAPDRVDLLSLRDLEGEALLGFLVGRKQRQVTSGPDGRFVIGGLVPGVHDLSAVAEGFTRQTVREVTTDGPEVQVVLLPELVIWGEVVDEAGSPVPRAHVQALRYSEAVGDVRAMFISTFGRRRSRGAAVRFEAETDSVGVFELRNLAGGTYRVEVEQDAFQKFISPYMTLDPAAPAQERDIVFELARGHTISGEVADSEGSPVVGARVRVRYTREAVEPGATEEAAGGGSRRRERGRRDRGRGGNRPRYLSGMVDRLSEGEREHETRTDAGGSFAFNNLRPGIYSVEIRLREHLRTRIEDVETGSESLDVVLGPVRLLAGWVVNATTGEAVAYARVDALAPRDDGGEDERSRRWRRRTRRRSVDSTRTDQDGNFRFGGPEQGSVDLRVRAAGFLTVDLEAVVPGSAEELTLEVVPAGFVTGTVRGPGGETLTGITVYLRRDDSAEGQDGGRERGRRSSRWGRERSVSASVVTDENGEYVISVKERATVKVVARGDPYVTTRSDPVEIAAPTSEVTGIDITMRDSARVAGVVLASTDLPLAGATVDVFNLPDDDTDDDENASEESRRRRRSERYRRARSRGGSDRTDANGRFEVAGLESGRFELRARAPGHVDFQSAPFSLETGQKHTENIALVAEQAISGTVFSIAGDPLGAAEISAVRSGEEQSSGSRFSRGWSEFFRHRTITGPLGNYRIGKLQQGSFNVRALAEGYSSRYVEGIDAGTDHVDIVLDPLVTLEGNVVGASSGEPLTRFRLRLQAVDEERLARRERDALRSWRSFENPDGSFVIEDLPHGRYTVAVDAPEAIPVADIEIDLPEGSTLQNRVLTVPEGGVLGGVVLDKNSQPVPDARIQAFVEVVDENTGKRSFSSYSSPFDDGRSRGRGRRSSRRGQGRSSSELVRQSPRGEARSTEDGFFLVRGLPGGVYQLRVTHADLVGKDTESRQIVVGDDGYSSGADFRVVLKDGAVVRGRVLGTGGQSGAGVLVTLTGGVERKSARADAGGRFDIRGLAPGTYALRTIALGGRERSSRRGGPDGFGAQRRRAPSAGAAVQVEIGEKDKVQKVELTVGP